MNPQTAGIKLAAAIDKALVGTTQSAHLATYGARAFWSAFTAELARRRAARAMGMTGSAAEPF